MTRREEIMKKLEQDQHLTYQCKVTWKVDWIQSTRLFKNNTKRDACSDIVYLKLSNWLYIKWTEIDWCIWFGNLTSFRDFFPQIWNEYYFVVNMRDYNIISIWSWNYNTNYLWYEASEKYWQKTIDGMLECQDGKPYLGTSYSEVKLKNDILNQWIITHQENVVLPSSLSWTSFISSVLMLTVAGLSLLKWF